MNRNATAMTLGLVFGLALVGATLAPAQIMGLAQPMNVRSIEQANNAAAAVRAPLA